MPPIRGCLLCRRPSTIPRPTRFLFRQTQYYRPAYLSRKLTYKFWQSSCISLLLFFTIENQADKFGSLYPAKATMLFDECSFCVITRRQPHNLPPLPRKRLRRTREISIRAWASSQTSSALRQYRQSDHCQLQQFSSFNIQIIYEKLF